MSDEFEADWSGAATGGSPWAPAFAVLRAELWRWRLGVALAACLGAAIGGAAKISLPPANVATAQILFKPEGVKIFSNDLTPTRIDANAQIDFVESQMGVLVSQRVLARALASECAPDAGAGDPASVPPVAFLRLCPNSGAPESEKAIDTLRRMIVIKRAERSFLVDVQISAGSPEFAAALANAIVNAYIDEDASDRAGSANRVTKEITARLADLHAALGQAENKAQADRNEKRLIQVGDRLLVEQRLADASSALTAAESQVEKARARVAQLEDTPLNATAIGALGDDADMRTLVLMLDRLTLAQADIAPLAARLVNHPTLIQARSRVVEAQRAVAAEIKGIRASVRGGLQRSLVERDNLRRTVTEIAGEVSIARQDQVALRSLEQTVDTDRHMVETFETRAREAEEFGGIDPNSTRVASLARPPQPHRLALAATVWAVVGAALFGGLAISGLGLRAIAAAGDGRAPPDDEQSPGDHDRDSRRARLMRASPLRRYA